MSGLVDVRKAVDTVYLDISKAFNIVSCNIFLEKLVEYGLDEQTVRAESWLNGLAQRAEISGIKSS